MELYPKVKDSEYDLVLIQINEAHSDRWPLGFNYHPPVQKDFADRLQKANDFAKTCPYDIYVDTWEDSYEITYHAWPDQFCLIETATGKVLDKSRYHKNALIMNDYAEFLGKHV